MTPAIATRFFSPPAQMMRNPAGKVLDPYHPQGFVHPVVDGLCIETEIGGAEGNILLNGG
ncbi:MAG: hypothetical protein MZV70_14055 [Desulfobacterales bacterium]|nr:hypothetical protein [Desulfobacterales bacterium]